MDPQKTIFRSLSQDRPPPNSRAAIPVAADISAAGENLQLVPEQRRIRPRNAKLSEATARALCRHFFAGTPIRIAAAALELNKNTAELFYKRLRAIIGSSRDPRMAQACTNTGGAFTHALRFPVKERPGMPQHRADRATNFWRRARRGAMLPGSCHAEALSRLAVEYAWRRLPYEDAVGVIANHSCTDCFRRP
jgi:hypothetical protein